MAEYYYDGNAYVKDCHKCGQTYVGGTTQVDAERVLSKYFSQDRSTRDGFYARCKSCVSLHQRNSRYGNCDSEELLKQQDNKCGICDKPISFELNSMSKRTAYVDHDHKTGNVRGILCVRCNSLLHMVEDDNLLQKGLAYLERYK